MITDKPLRGAMPQVSAWIDDLRHAFGAEVIDAAIKASAQGAATFPASENGRTFGTPLPPAVHAWRLEGFSARHFCKGCAGECVGTPQPCKHSPG